MLTGQPGIGKSTLASGFEKPLFVEVKSRTGHLDVARVQVKTWDDVIKLVKEALSSNTYKTLVFDTINDMEELALEHIAKERGASDYMDIGGGFAKYRGPLKQQLRRFLVGVDRLQRAGIQVIMVAHTAIETYTPPDSQTYDRYVIKADKMTASTLTENVDLIGYAHYDVRVTDVGGLKKSGKAKSKSKRVIDFKHNPAYPSKKGIPCADSCDLNYEAFQKALSNE
jgi:hypothetical protein